MDKQELFNEYIKEIGKVHKSVFQSKFFLGLNYPWASTRSKMQFLKSVCPKEYEKKRKQVYENTKRYRKNHPDRFSEYRKKVYQRKKEAKKCQAMEK